MKTIFIICLVLISCKPTNCLQDTYKITHYADIRVTLNSGIIDTISTTFTYITLDTTETTKTGFRVTRIINANDSHVALYFGGRIVAYDVSLFEVISYKKHWEPYKK